MSVKLEKTGMTRIGRRLIEDFLLPALDDGRYGELLKWIDKDNCYFSIRWSHKNAAKWSLDDTAVFQDWDKLKGHYHPEVKGYYMQAKQRFRAALYKLNSVRRLPCDDKHVKKYQLILDPEKRRAEYLNKTKGLYARKAAENNNRVSVITKHSSFEGKQEPIYYAPPVSPPSPTSSDRSDSSDSELAKCIHDFKEGQKNHNQMLLNMSSNSIRFSPKKESPLREVNDDSIRGIVSPQRMPHLPIQPVPVYNFAPSKRFESPHLLLVKTYNEFDNSHAIKAEYDYEEVVSDSSDYVLNLSVKSDDSDVLSR
ncbi:uncharacterized protein [Parasteatoda tepidariorum]|uniref:uncharacterized protein isoform X2 n=1 Tax=Parasteatoda tepidariorum TaxID=114398 RepID=UPI00077FC829|nr:uncharacterized protein LOC107454653 isoform X2 [Parasteatoda tepidariorum]